MADEKQIFLLKIEETDDLYLTCVFHGPDTEGGIPLSIIPRRCVHLDKSVLDEWIRLMERIGKQICEDRYHCPIDKTVVRFNPKLS